MSLAQEKEQALLALDRASRRVRAAAGAPKTTQALAREHLRRAEAKARELGILPTQEELETGGIAWARALFIKAWRRRDFARSIAGNKQIPNPFDQAVGDAAAIAEEWGLDVDRLAKEAAGKDRR